MMACYCERQIESCPQLTMDREETAHTFDCLIFNRTLACISVKLTGQDWLMVLIIGLLGATLIGVLTNNVVYTIISAALTAIGAYVICKIDRFLLK